MTLVEQAGNRDSELVKFLDERLPYRTDVAHMWLAEMGAAAENRGSADLDRVGMAFELRVGLDLANRAGWWPVLEFLRPDDYQFVLEAAGFAAGPPGCESLDTATTDPVLRTWERASRPEAIDDIEMQVLRVLARVVAMNQVAYKLPDFFTVERRRRDFAQIGSAEPRPGMVEDLCGLWQDYLDRGRSQLLALGAGDRVIVGPEIVPSFATADLVVGSTLVEVKVSTKHETMMPWWLNQALGYVLLDRWDVLRIDRLGIYSARHGRLVSMGLAELLTCARHGHAINVRPLRDGLRGALHDDLEAAERDHSRRRLQP